MAKKLPLEGIRILDITVIWVGPYATQLLADWGAEVIRVETRYNAIARGQARVTPEQAQAAGLTGFGYAGNEPGDRPWNRGAVVNAHSRNKKSMTVDMTRPEGREVFRDLVAKSDLVMENNVPETMEKLGVTWDELSKINPELILVHIPAFGLEGPWKNYRTYGSHMEAIAGHLLLRTYPGMDPGQISDVFPADAGGAGAAYAALVGLFHRKKTGKGQVIEIATSENFIPYIGDFVMDYTMNQRVSQNLGNTDTEMAPHNVYRCVGDDRWVAIACRDDQDWTALTGAMGNPEWATDSRFQDPESRLANRDALDEFIGAWTANQENWDVMKSLQDAGVPSGIVADEADSFADPHLEDRGFFEELTHPEAGTHRYPGIQWKTKKTPNSIRRAAARLGEDNEYVYKELLGFSDEKYKEYEELGHIGMDYDESVT